MYIPKKIKIGFQERNDTYTKKLAYIIYYDEKGVLRKKASWESWCEKKIPSIEFENKPQVGYLFNKGIQRHGYWGNGRNVIRVYDPRDFEFEISVDNLIGILMHSDVSKRDIVQECIFAWEGPELVLLPTNSEEYKTAVHDTIKQESKISAKELVKGCSYQKKKSDEIYTYLGYFHWYDFHSCEYEQSLKGKKHIFYDSNGKFHPITLSILAYKVDDTIDDRYSFRIDEFFKTLNSSKVVNVKVAEITNEILESKFEQYTLEPHWMQNYPIPLYKQENGYISRLKYGGSFTYLKTENRSNFSEQRYTFSNGVLVQLKQKLKNSSYNSYYYPREIETSKFEVPLELVGKIHDLLEFEVLNKEVWIKVLRKLGYGALEFQLENGNSYIYLE